MKIVSSMAQGANPTVSTSKLPVGSGQVSNRAVLKAIVVGGEKRNKQIGQSKSIDTEKVLANTYRAGLLVEPPFDPLVLSMLPEHSTELRQCIDAMITNVHGFGWKLEPRVPLKSLPSLKRKEAAREYLQLFNFISNCCLRGTFTQLRYATGENLCTNGNSFWEVVRKMNTPEIDAWNHMRVHEMRLGFMQEEAVEVDVPRIEIGEGSVNIVKIKQLINFRKYAQLVILPGAVAAAKTNGFGLRWFKEFGDPRIIDARDGHVYREGKEEPIPEEHQASEIFHWKRGVDRSPYGLPTLIGNLLTLFGDRAADEINFTTLKNNNIPSMAILVSGGQASDGTIKRIKEFSAEVIEGSGNYSKFLILEGESALEDGSDTGAVKIDIKPLVDVQTRDSMFQEYQKNNAKKIRGLFRLPPIFVGASDSYNRATAEAARKLADEQIFAPERSAFDDVINNEFLPRMGFKYYKLVSQGPNVTDDEDLVRILSVAERTGALTPQIARTIIGDIMGKDLGQVESIDPDKPYSMQMAEAVKNQAEMDVGTQVTALKDTVLATLKDTFTSADPAVNRDLLMDAVKEVMKEQLKPMMQEVARDLLLGKNA